MNIYKKSPQLNFALSLIISLSIFVFFTFDTRADTANNSDETKVPIDVGEYATALQELQKQSKRQTIEPVYALGIAAAKRLGLVLERLSPADFDLVKDQMKGFQINRTEVIYVLPDAIFFKNLAGQKGQDIDMVFFDLLHKTRPNNVWPVYIEQRTDYSGCTKYGTGLLVEFYGKWSKFRVSYPSAYKTDVENVLEDITRGLLNLDGACGSSLDVIKEYNLFLQAYPKSKPAEEIKRKLSEIGLDNPNKK